jgi:hypothetical protein
MIKRTYFFSTIKLASLKPPLANNLPPGKGTGLNFLGYSFAQIKDVVG